jgi:hypothetical protein
MKHINLAPILQNYPDNVNKELELVENYPPFLENILYLWWEGDECPPERYNWFPKTKQWLVETYGEEIKQYSIFAIIY